MSKQVILLTGATGFLGSEVAKALVNNGHQVVIIKREQSDLKRLDSIKHLCSYYNVDDLQLAFSENKIDTIIHTATSYGRKGESEEDVLNANLVFPFILLQCALRNNVKKFINTGTALNAYTNAYSLSKHQFSNWLNFYQKSLCICEVILEYFYGPGDDSWKFVTMVFEKIMKEEPFIEFTSGMQKRDFIYISDVVSAFVSLVNSNFPKGMHSFPLGSGNPVTIKELVYQCSKIANNNKTELKFGSLPDRALETDNIVCNTSMLKEIGWTDKIGLEEGLEITWQYYLSKNDKNVS
jgi:nucleoside-diphosphate-sugar epimerase